MRKKFKLPTRGAKVVNRMLTQDDPLRGLKDFNALRDDVKREAFAYLLGYARSLLVDRERLESLMKTQEEIYKNALRSRA